MSDYIWRVRKEFAGGKLPKTREGVAQAIAAAKAGKTPVVIADHADRSGGSTFILEELIRQGASNFCVATIADEKAIQEIEASAKVGDAVSVQVGGYLDKYAGDPVPIEGELEYLDGYGRFEKVAVIRFGEDNRLILTPTLHQVTTRDIFDELGIDVEETDIVALKTRVHFRRGFHETGLAGAIFEVDAPGWGPADLTELPYENIPKDVYPVYTKE
jgi:microcystin degradation protein MlrC